jgi:hypothetical protein
VKFDLSIDLLQSSSDFGGATQAVRRQEVRFGAVGRGFRYVEVDGLLVGQCECQDCADGNYSGEYLHRL